MPINHHSVRQQGARTQADVEAAPLIAVIDLRFLRIEGLPNRDPIQLEVVVTNHNTTTADAQTYEGRSVFSSWVRAPLSNAQEVQILVGGVTDRCGCDTPHTKNAHTHTPLQVRSAIAIKGKVRKPIGAATIKATDALQHLGKTKPT